MISILCSKKCWFIAIFLFCINCEETISQTFDKFWSQIPHPASGIEEIVALNSKIIARSKSRIYISEDLGKSWTKANHDDTFQQILDIEVSENVIYAALDGPFGTKLSRIEASYDGGKTFVPFFGFFVDAPISLDFEKAVGWLNVDSWGLYSGISKLTTDGKMTNANGDLPYSYQGALRKIVADKNNPFNIAYTYGYRGDSGTKCFRTLNGGKNWLTCKNIIIYSAAVNGLNYAIGEKNYSTDYGETWKDLPFEINAIVTNTSKENFFVAKKGGGIYLGSINNLTPVGLSNVEIISIAINSGMLTALSTDGRIFISSILTNTNNATFNKISKPHSLELVYPNPASQDITIKFLVQEKNHVSLNVYNSMWEKTATIIHEKLTPGEYSINWNASKLESGVYILQLESNRYSDLLKIIILD